MTMPLMPKRAPLVVATCALALLAAGCMTAAEHQQSLGSTGEREMTLGVVQKEIYTGLTQDQVAAALGSPNIVARRRGRETWIYDKIATEASYRTATLTARFSSSAPAATPALYVAENAHRADQFGQDLKVRRSRITRSKF